MEMVDPSTLKIPLCQTALVTVDGLQCAVIDTNLRSDDISLNNLKAIVNPFNWNENYPAFFLKMAPFRDPFRSDRWRRVLETVGFGELGGLDITTALKYHPTIGECEARLDYDLDDPTPGPGDGQVLVDRGYINMWATKRARPRSARGSGADPEGDPHQRLVALRAAATGLPHRLRHGVVGVSLRLPLNRRKMRAIRLLRSREQPEEDPETSASGPSTHVVATAVNLWTDSVQDLVNDYFEVAEKWMAGGLRLSDVTDFSQKVTGRLVSSPLEFLERVNQPRYPRGRPSDTQQDRPSQTQQGGAP